MKDLEKLYNLNNKLDALYIAIYKTSGHKQDEVLQEIWELEDEIWELECEFEC